MPLGFTGAAWPFLVSALVALALSVYVFAQRPSAATRYLAIVTLLAGLWSACSAAHLLVDSIESKIFWVQFKYVFTATLPVFWLLFALAHAGYKAAVQPLWIILLMVYPAFEITLVATNTLHGLMFEVVYPLDGPTFTTIAHEYGPMFWVSVAYSYTVVGAGFIAFAVEAVRRKGYLQRQAILLTLTALIPFAVNVAFLYAPEEQRYLDYTPVSFVLSSVAFAVVFFRYRMFELMPIAREEVITMMDAPLFVTDPDGFIVDANRAATGLLRSFSASMVGRPLRSILPEFDSVWNAVSRDGDARKDVQIERGGEARWYSVSAKQLDSDRVGPVGYTMLLHDVTELYAAKERAMELSTLKSRFLSNMSHEIRTPLSAIIGISDLMKQGDETQREMAGMIRRSSDRLMRMLNSVLSVSHIQAGTISQDPEPVDVVEILTGIVPEFEQAARDKGLSFSVRLPSGPQKAQIDPNHVTHVLSHLLDNAVRYTESGEVAFRAFIHEDVLRFEVRDTGPGIEEEYLPELNDPFSRADLTANRSTDGAGLGLAVVSGLLSVMGGDLDIETREGSGTRVTVTLQRWFESSRSSSEGFLAQPSEDDEPAPGPGGSTTSRSRVG